MSDIKKLFEKEFVLERMKEKVLPMYPDFCEVKDVEIKAHKKFIWESSFHVVVEFRTIFIDKEGQEVELPIFCSAHSGEERENVYKSLKFLWDHGFAGDEFSVPHPLFYSDKFKGIFYRGVEGRNLYRFIREDDRKVIDEMIPQTAKWFARLHSISVDEAINFNEVNSRIETVLPGVDHILERMEKDYPQYLEIFREAYRIFTNNENAYLNSTKARQLVHGDAHPENIIRMNEEKIGVIDFTDLSLGDFARDLGTFLQQLEYMCERKIGDEKYIVKIKNLFLNAYFEDSEFELTDDVLDRIDNYYYWTMMRTSTFFLFKADAEPERAKPLIQKLCNDLGLDYNE